MKRLLTVEPSQSKRNKTYIPANETSIQQIYFYKYKAEAL